MKGTATAKLALENRGSNPKQPVKIRVTFGRDHRLYSTGHTGLLTKEEFANDKLKITKKAIENSAKALGIAQQIINNLGRDFSFREFTRLYKEQLHGKKKDNSLFSNIAEAYMSNKDLRNKTKDSYTTACRWLEKYRPSARIDDINAVFISDLASFIQKENKKQGRDTSPNTISMYMRNLRCIYNYGVQKNGLSDKKPFQEINTTSKRRLNYSLTEEELKTFISYSPANNLEEFGKDFFLLSLFLSGINIGDVLRLKNKNIRNDIVCFKRNKTIKTGIETKIPLTSSAKALLNKYGSIDPAKPEDRILPYLMNCETESAIENKIHDIIKKTNRGLKLISKSLGINQITSYVARHTFATLSVGHLDIVEIQKGLGHVSSKTTELYIDSITTKTINKTRDFLENITTIKI